MFQHLGVYLFTSQEAPGIKEMILSEMNNAYFARLSQLPLTLSECSAFAAAICY